MYDWVRLFHLLAAAIWTGGLVVLGGAVMALRKTGAEREQFQAVARAYGRVAWTAMGLAVITGIWQLLRFGEAASNPASEFGQALLVKLLAVGTAAALTLWHQMTAGTMSPKARGIIQGLILVVSIGIFAAAVWLGSASL